MRYFSPGSTPAAPIEVKQGRIRLVIQSFNELKPRIVEGELTVCNVVPWFSRWLRKWLRRMARRAPEMGLASLLLLASTMASRAGVETPNLPLWMGAITTAVATSFKVELGTATHNFTASTGDTFKAALYTSSATLSASTTAYAGTNEVASGGGYTTGGNTLTSSTPTSSGTTVIFDFADTSWTTATFTARGMLIYNSSKSNKAVAIWDFGADQTVTSGTFTIQFPAPDASNAILRM